MSTIETDPPPPEVTIDEFGEDAPMTESEAHKIFAALTRGILANGGSPDLLRLILDHGPVQDEIAQTIILAERPLHESEHWLRVPYGPLPSIALLRKQFGRIGLSGLRIPSVSELFDGRAWNRRPSCIGVDETPGQRIFGIHHFKEAVDEAEAIRRMRKRRHRPVTHEELYWFQHGRPLLRTSYDIIALGTISEKSDGIAYAAKLGASSFMGQDIGTSLGDVPIDSLFEPQRSGFLSIREP